MGNQVNVTTIDVDLNPDIANKFKINQLPTVVLGNEKILTGYMNEDEIRDRLWNKIFQTLILKDTSFERRKEQIFVLSKNIIDSLTKDVSIRPNIGDYTHIGALQITNMSLLALDKLASNLIYDAGKLQGLYGVGQMMITTLNPGIHKKIKISDRFKEIINGVILFLSNNERFPLFLSEGAELLDISESTASIRVFGSAFAVASPELGEPLCWSFAGEIAGWIQSILGKIIKVTEIACWGLGNSKHCDFFVEILNEESSPVLSPYKGKKELTERRMAFQTTLMLMADNFEQSHFMKKRLRPKIGDYVHISVVQGTLTAIKLKDKFLGMLLYSAGSTFGLTGPGKHIIQNLISHLNVNQPMELEQAVKLLVKELQHPKTLLTRQHSFIDYSIDEENEKARITIHENVYASGLGNVNEKFCDFTAGFIHGRLQLLISDNLYVKEISCHGSAESDCTIEITID
jgi:predicted hydrocarbon binding protein